MLLCLCESTIEIIVFIILPFKHVAISSVDTEQGPSPGFAVKKNPLLKSMQRNGDPKNGQIIDVENLII